MKDKRFDGIIIPLENVSQGVLELICLAADKNYDKAFQIIEEYIYEAKDIKQHDIAVMVFLQILALQGQTQIAATLLKALLKKFKPFSKERYLCQKTIKLLTK